MLRPLRKFFRIFLSYNRADRNAIFILSVLILLAIGLKMLIHRLPVNPGTDIEDFKKMYAAWEHQNKNDESISLRLFPFDPNTVSKESLDSINLPQNIKNNILKYRDAGGKYYSVSDVRKIYGFNDSIFDVLKDYITIEKHKPRYSKKKVTPQVFSGSFNPNSSSKSEMEEFGLNPFQIKNILAYREKGGKFRKKNDLLKIYGVDSACFNQIKKFIIIDSIFTKKTNSPVKQDFTVELNSADSVTLIHLRGIGPVFASRIIKYRELLGGFYSKKQLLEVYHLSPETFGQIENFISVDTSKIQCIRINFASYRELLKHPYINKKMVEEIIKKKENFGPIENINELKSLDSVDSISFVRVRPYLSCR